MKFNAKWLAAHPTIQASDAVRQTVEPFLQKHRLVHFSYVKRYQDGSNFSLTTHPEMAIDFHRHALYSSGDFSEDLSQHDNEALLWLATNTQSQKLFHYAREAHRLSNGVVLVNRAQGFEEQFYFAATPEHPEANNFYLNNLDLLKRFNQGFIEKMSDVIKTGDKNRLPMSFEHTEHAPMTTIHLTPREAGLMHFLAQGYSCKRIADTMGIKVKTVYFYLDNLKQKTALHNRDALVSLYRMLNGKS